MALHPALRHLIETKLAAARPPQWELPIAEVRRGFRALWTPAMTGAPLAVDRVDEVSIPADDAPIPARPRGAGHIRSSCTCTAAAM